MSVTIWQPGMSLDAIERQVIEKAFVFYQKNKSATARALGISVRTLENKFDKYGRDDQAEKDADEQRQREHADFVARSRGQIVPTDGAQATAGNGLEPAPRVATQPTVPVQERREVQAVLSAEAASGGSRRAR